MVKAPTLAELAEMATDGMTDQQVRDKTQLTQSTWYKIKTGDPPGLRYLIQFAVGMGLSVDSVLDAANVSVETNDLARSVLMVGLQLAGLSAESRIEIMRLFTESVRADSERQESAA